MATSDPRGHKERFLRTRTLSVSSNNLNLLLANEQIDSCLSEKESRNGPENNIFKIKSGRRMEDTAL